MAEPTSCPLAVTLAGRLRGERDELVRRWLHRIADRVSIDAGEVFPTEELLDHVPLLIDGIAEYLADPAEEITADMPVVAKAMELGELRHTQGFDVHEILKEYELLGGVLFDFLIQTADHIEEPCSRGELLVCGHRVFRSVAVIQQYTTGHFLRLSEERVREREDRLRSFNRTLSHELKNRIGAARGASDILREEWMDGDPDQRRRFAGIVSRNLGAVQETLSTLIEVSRVTTDGLQGRNVVLPDAVAEVKRQLREFAESRGVDVRVADLPTVEVPAAVVELALSNFVSNGIKYRDPASAEPWVRVEAEVREDGREVTVRVVDNGLGVPDEAREKLFERFFRAHETITGEEGSGLGLSIVRETLDPVGGRAWAEYPEQGSVFAFAVPVPERDPAPDSTSRADPV